MKKSSLVTKLVVTFALVVATGFVLMAVVLTMWFQNYFLERNRADLEETTTVASSSVPRYLNKEIDDTELLQSLSLIKGVEKGDILLVDASGYVFFVTNTAYEETMFTQFDFPDRSGLLSGNSIEVNGTRNPVTGEEMSLYIKPVIASQAYQGAIVVYTPMEKIWEPLNEIYVRLWTMTIIAVLLSALLIYYIAQRMLFRPLVELNNIARKISKGEVNQRVLVTSNDEIGQLSESFNSMAESLEKTDKNRRDFLSNISHELRSPITSIRGFIAGILDGIIPMDKERDYLKIVYDEIQRLTRLVNDLLDLSAMESGKFSFKMTELDINEIVRICVTRFETKINDKALKVNVTLEGDHLYVAGDRDRLIQVLTNLTDNAVKHCMDNGHINIQTKIKGKKVHVSVYNDGHPISDEDIRYIWDRFYKGDKSRTNKVSTGLGLPIVRNIITQFGEDIWVENKGQGVIFTFTLSMT
ncbi:HAMP domain-containing histidine kinase [Proteiniclasticum sp. BAD-10]|uniref:histidine kinase n=1 Tax=Proteiniclasticum sediminis TaxID=2804028 RepID=A0A941CPB9_9CLOT|nr:HAMP domain-containing sensor histidine kinase [Proteiniclasticum sediminis]MBR0576406.1 HAMP domain-containing histidine kinase [Proteiniclasticum sediminis]